MYFSNLLARYCNRSTLLISSEEEENLANDRRSIFRHKLYVIFTMFLHNRKIITYFSYFSSSFFTIVLHFHDKITFKIARSRKKEKERKPRISRSSPHSLLIHWLTKRTTEVFQSKCIHRGDGGSIRIVVIRRVVTAILRELCNLVTVAQRNCGKVVDTFRKVVGCINTGGYHGTRAWNVIICR